MPYNAYGFISPLYFYGIPGLVSLTRLLPVLLSIIGLLPKDSPLFLSKNPY